MMYNFWYHPFQQCERPLPPVKQGSISILQEWVSLNLLSVTSETFLWSYSGIISHLDSNLLK